MDFSRQQQAATKFSQFFQTPAAALRKFLQTACVLFPLSFLLILAQPSPIPDSCTQLLLVLTPSYSATEGFLYKFQREKQNAPWQRIDDRIPIVVGRSGLGWGSGLHASTPQGHPIKQEGDGRSPAGAFALSTAFGFSAAGELAPLHFPYQQITQTLECVDDPASQYYNDLIDLKKMENADWQSSEKMHNVPVDYRLGVFVDHNTAPAKPGGGSCIFLHVWGNPVAPTAGCTAMAEAEMQKIITWLKREAKPILVQLPQEEYTRLQDVWKLPGIK